MTKEITLEDLAVMINNMDQRIDKRFTDVDKRFINVDRRFVEIDKKFIDVIERLDRIEDKQVNVAYKFELKALEKRVSALES